MSWQIIEYEGRTYRVPVARCSDGVWVGWPGGSALVAPAREFAGRAERDDSVRAPMTGKVLRVLVAEQDVVEKDQVLVVMEAMKMEYRLTAPGPGTVEATHCVEGELVDQGTVLVSLGET